MMIAKQRLFTPGPTPLHPVVQEALARQIPHHRTEEFRALVKACARSLQDFLKTEAEVLLLACSGTGAMEAAVVNVLAPGDTMLALVAGSFGERWVALGQAHGMNVRVVEAPWGQAVQPEALAEALASDPSIRAVFVQLSESSTGVRHDVERLARVLRDASSDALLVVDAISGAGALPLAMDAWGLDVVIVGSQKALALPPGLTFLSLSARAWERAETLRTPRFYFDLRRERRAQAQGEPAFTPAISHVVALHAALRWLESAGGVDMLVHNAATLAAMTRAAAGEWGLPLVAPDDHGDALTALYPPEGLSAPDLVKALKREFGSTVAGGQGRLQGRILRIAHLGYYDVTDQLGLLASVELALARLGRAVEFGRGVAAAQRVYRERVA